VECFVVITNKKERTMKKFAIILTLAALAGVQAQAITKGTTHDASGLITGEGTAHGTSSIITGPNPALIHVVPGPFIDLGPEVTATEALEELKPETRNPVVNKTFVKLHNALLPLVEQNFKELQPTDQEKILEIAMKVKQKALALRRFFKDKENLPVLALELIKVLAIIDRKKSELAEHAPSEELAFGFIALQKASDAVKHTLIKLKKKMVKEGVRPLTGLAGVTHPAPIGGGHYAQMLAGAKAHCAAEGKASGTECSECVREGLEKVGITPPMGFDAVCFVE